MPLSDRELDGLMAAIGKFVLGKVQPLEGELVELRKRLEAAERRVVGLEEKKSWPRRAS